jgi:acylphosphatase
MSNKICGKIHLEGNFGNTGFGFSCMQQAAKLDISGKFEYQNQKEITILSIGTTEAINDFFQWCLQQNHSGKGELTLLSSPPFRYKEFHIVNHL